MPARTLVAGFVLATAASAATAQTVSFAGSMGSKALLVIDGQPHTLAVGQSAQGVTLLRLADGHAQVEVAGGSVTLRIGGAPARLAGTSAAAGSSVIVLPAGSGGHFTSAGTINGRPVQFMVDTGATLVSLSQTDAERIGLDFRSGQRGITQTANGPVPVHLVMLSAVRVGEVEVANVQAVVMPAQMPYVLLGNSFLSRFQMRRDNDVMHLERR